MIPDSERLFDPEGVARDVELTLGDGPVARPARVGFLAAMLAVWILGSGRGSMPTAAQKEYLKDEARDLLERVERHLTTEGGDR